MIALISLINIEISGDDHRNTVTQLVGFPYNQFGTFFTCFYPDVVEMCIEEEKLKTRLFLFEKTSCTNPWQYCVPSLVGRFGIFGKPKIAVLNHVKFIDVI